VDGLPPMCHVHVLRRFFPEEKKKRRMNKQ
jgi:hypothetical protein